MPVSRRGPPVCVRHNLRTTMLRMKQVATRCPETRRVLAVDITIHLPGGFPEPYAGAVVRAAGACTVKKHLAEPPEIRIATRAAR